MRIAEEVILRVFYCSALFIFFGLNAYDLAFARPEYAVRHQIVSCTACHYSPAGGGPKKMAGKLYASRNFKPNPFLIQDKVSADFRYLFYLPENAKANKSGTGIMVGALALHLQLDEQKKSTFVLEHNAAGFSSAQYRDTYLLYRFNKEGQYDWLESILIGRFHIPFGIMTDEHRTYTRIETGTEWNSIQNGFLLSGTPNHKTHIDVAAMNGYNSSGQSLNRGNSNLWGFLVNARYLPSFYLVGVSARTDRNSQTSTSHAWSLYTVISLARWSLDKIPVAIKMEYAQAEGTGVNLGQGLASDPDYVSSLGSSTSEGLYTRIDWSISKKLNLVYKFDQLTPDIQYRSDYYSRHGLGLEMSLAALTKVLVRTEMAEATHPSEEAKVGSLAQNASYMILEVSF